jgi:hypothetical protein
VIEIKIIQAVDGLPAVPLQRIAKIFIRIYLPVAEPFACPDNY